MIRNEETVTLLLNTLARFVSDPDRKIYD